MVNPPVACPENSQRSQADCSPVHGGLKSWTPNSRNNCTGMHLPLFSIPSSTRAERHLFIHCCEIRTFAGSRCSTNEESNGGIRKHQVNGSLCTKDFYEQMKTIPEKGIFLRVYDYYVQ